MLTVKNIGIWMDHSVANIMAFTRDPIETKTIESKFTHAVKEYTLSKNENLMHNKEQHLQAEYYKQLMAIIENYQEVILFGPTNAKKELYNLINEDHKFEKIKITLFQTDKMTEPQQHAFVKQYFSENKHENKHNQ